MTSSTREMRGQEVGRCGFAAAQPPASRAEPVPVSGKAGIANAEREAVLPLPGYLRALASDCEWTDGWEAAVPDLLAAAVEIDVSRGLIPQLCEALAMSTAELMSGAKALEFRAEANADRRRVAAMHSQCDFNRSILAKATGAA